ncbi:MAG: ORF6N domain-containing protein [Rhodothermia bacterium]|nr:MAG: ORF6N domain-containing protein [Rhodothermia bacterium]
MSGLDKNHPIVKSARAAIAMKHSDESLSFIPDERIANKVFLIRGIKVMLDQDLAKLYGVETRTLNQAVNRNSDRFPEDFMFRLSKKELDNWRSQIVMSNPTAKMGLRRSPYAFAEQGVAMLSSVLRSKRAIQVNIQIIRIFIKFREIMASNVAMRRKIEKMDNQIQSIYKLLGHLLTEEEKPKRRIGFRTDDIG